MPLLIKTHLREVPNKGIGLIATDFISEGAVIYKDDLNFDKLIKPDEFEMMDPELKLFIETYCSFIEEYDAYYLCCDNARFINHSFKPTMDWDNDKKQYVAAKNINPGEELTSDYTKFDKFSKNGNFGFTVH